MFTHSGVLGFWGFGVLLLHGAIISLFFGEHPAQGTSHLLFTFSLFFSFWLLHDSFIRPLAYGNQLYLGAHHRVLDTGRWLHIAYRNQSYQKDCRWNDFKSSLFLYQDKISHARLGWVKDLRWQKVDKSQNLYLTVDGFVYHRSWPFTSRLIYN